MGRKKLTTADKIRRYMAAHPTARPKQIAEALGVRVEYVHVLRSTDKRKNAPKKLVIHAGEALVAQKMGVPLDEYAKQKMNLMKKPKVTKEMMQSVVDDLRAKRKEKISPLDTMPKVGDTVGGLTLTRAEEDGQYQYRWVRQAPELPITMEEPKSDPVNHPAHYKVGGIETIQYIKAKLTPEEYRGYLKGNLLKYSSRIGHKGAAQIDAGKAGWYANALVQAIEENSKPT